MRRDKFFEMKLRVVLLLNYYSISLSSRWHVIDWLGNLDFGISYVLVLSIISSYIFKYDFSSFE